MSRGIPAEVPMRLIGLAVILTFSLLLTPFVAETQQTGKVYRSAFSGLGANHRSRHPSAHSGKASLIPGTLKERTFHFCTDGRRSLLASLILRLNSFTSKSMLS